MLRLPARRPAGLRRLRRTAALVTALAVLAGCSSAPRHTPMPTTRTATPGGVASVAPSTPPVTSPAVTPPAVSATAPARPVAGVPAAGTAYFGVQLDWTQDTPSSYASRAGVRPAVYGEFLRFPLSASSRTGLLRHATQAKAAGAALFVTLEPFAGLGATTTRSATAAARVFASINHQGVRVYVRFAHEMNGNWYPWGQQPGAYVTAFRTFSRAVHRLAKNTSVVWSPNYGGGYPFTGGQYPVHSGTPDFTALDTTHDGRLTMDDDPYGPYYPGDQYVDWVGLTLYFFGLAYPWGENETPDAGRFVAQVRGTYTGASGDERGVPDFYAAFVAGRGKPMALSETGAFYRPGGPGASEQNVKTTWLNQVLGPQTRAAFPRLGMINWFEFEKQEQNIAGTVDWRATASPALRAALRRDLTSARGRFLFARRTG